VITKAHFDPGLFRFLRELAKHNDKHWFEQNRARYEADVRGPLLRFIADFAEPLARISRHYLADPRPMGGSMFRIHRDTRFAKDKTPYKTHAAAQFRHEAGKDVHAPGFYLHLEPGEVFVAAGLWHPDSAALGLIRAAIQRHPDRWKRAAYGKAFAAKWELSGESLQRPPKGVAADHPWVEDLRRKDFIAWLPFDEKQACRAGFLERVAGACADCAPLMQFLTTALELPW
jgi:uncharacterized protein (TIGR02453 family)